MRLFAPITKLDQEQHMVYGYASTEALDSQGEIITRAAIEAALPDYMRFANIREMHQPSAVGVACGAAVDDKGLYLTARVVDDDAWRKVKEGVYRGFSIGGRVVTRAPSNRRIITALELSEISLVDRPANPEAVIDVYKREAGADGGEAAAHDAPAGEPDRAPIQRMHDMAVALGATCAAAGADDAVPPDDLGKLAAGRGAALAKLAAIDARVEALAKAVREQGALLRQIADQPAPPKYAVETRAVDKAGDGIAKADEDAPKTALDAIRKAHRNPLRIDLF